MTDRRDNDHRSIEAYDVPERIASYDADMDVMHPNRHKMLDVALELIPFECGEEFLALDLGIGTGYVTQRLLRAFPNARVIAVDGAPAMIGISGVRLGPDAAKVEFKIGDFRDLDSLLDKGERGRLVISAYALHHLDLSDKCAVVRRCVEFLEPGGWFINADVIIGATPALEARYQELRIAGILERASAGDERFSDGPTTRAFLDRMEAAEGDQPQRLLDDLEVLANAGFASSGVFWSEYREAVTGGVRGDTQVS